MSKTALGWGIVGIGRIADDRMAPAINAFDCNRLIAVVSRDQGRADAFAAKFGAKHALTNRFMPCFVETKRIVESGEIGDVVAVQMEASGGNRGAVAQRRSWRLDPAMAGFGTINNIGVHVYDVLRFILSSEIAEVSAFFDTPPGELEELAYSMFRFENGVMAQYNVNQILPYPHNDFVVYGTKGRITGVGLTRSRFSGELQVLTEAGERRTEYPTIDAHREALGAFCQALLKGEEPSPSGLDGLRSVQLTDAMARSARQGVHVRLSYA